FHWFWFCFICFCFAHFVSLTLLFVILSLFSFLFFIDYFVCFVLLSFFCFPFTFPFVHLFCFVSFPNPTSDLSQPHKKLDTFLQAIIGLAFSNVSLEEYFAIKTNTEQVELHCFK